MNTNSEAWKAMEPVPEDEGDPKHAEQWAIACNKQRRKVWFIFLEVLLTKSCEVGKGGYANI